MFDRKPVNITEVILCFECKWEGYVINTKSVDFLTEEMKGSRSLEAVPIKAFHLCPNCDLPLVNEMKDRTMQLVTTNAIEVPFRHRFSPRS